MMVVVLALVGVPATPDAMPAPPAGQVVWADGETDDKPWD
jgi:hypothetical protein